MSIHICLLTNQYYPYWGGVAKSAQRIVGCLQKYGVNVSVIVPRKEKDSSNKRHFKEIIDSPETGVHGERIYRADFGSINESMGNMIDFLLLFNFVRPVDLYHGFWLPLAYPAIVASSGSVPVVASIRGNDAVRSLGCTSKSYFSEVALRKASWVTSVSKDLIRKASVLSDIESKSSVILNSIDSSALDSEPWTPSNAVLGDVGIYGDLRFKKGAPYLIEAFSRVDVSLRNKLHLIGPFSDLQEEMYCRLLARRSGIQSNVIFHGFCERNEALEKLRKLNVFVMPSIHDGLPNTLLEVAAFGVPIVASDVGGMADVIKNEENGLLVAPANADALAKAISRILSDKRLAKKLSFGGRELVQDHNPREELMGFINVYRKFIEI